MSLNSIQLNVTLLSVHLKDFSFYNKRQSVGKHMQRFRDGQTPVQDEKNRDMYVNIPSRHQRCRGVSPFQLHTLDALHKQKSQYRRCYMLIRGVNII